MGSLDEPQTTQTGSRTEGHYPKTSGPPFKESNIQQLTEHRDIELVHAQTLHSYVLSLWCWKILCRLLKEKP